MLSRHRLIAPVLCGTLLLLAGAVAAEPAEPAQEKKVRPVPTVPTAIAACEALSAGDDCSFTTHIGKQSAGKCKQLPRALLCRAERPSRKKGVAPKAVEAEAATEPSAPKADSNSEAAEAAEAAEANAK